MKKMLWLLLLLCIACNNAPQDLEQLEGYWQIEKVVAPDGGEREYPFSLKLEYFQVKDSVGKKFRVSVKDKDKFVSDRTGVPFTYYLKEGDLFLKFAEGNNAYVQEVETLNAETLVLVHENGLEYRYRRFEK